MSYLDESEYDDRTRDERGTGEGRRSAQPARPAWDAATYGTPDDLRRSRTPPPSSPSRGRPASHYRYAESPAAPPTYPDAPAYPETPSYSGDGASRDDESYTYPYSPDPYPYPPPEPEPYRSELRVEVDEPSMPQPHPIESYPGGVDSDAGDAAEAPNGRAGRNLPAAIGVGVLLAGTAIGSLFLWRPAFLGVIAVVVGVGTWELARAVRTGGANPPIVPLVAGGALMTGLAWWGHADALTFGLMVTLLAAMVWRLADGPGGYGRDITAAAMVAVYVPFLMGFAALLATPADGHLRVVVTLAAIVLSDTGGYVAGVLLGRHPMAPSISPRKSWEGLAGSLLATAAGSAVLLFILFDVQVWWGAVFGLAVSAAAVLGDLGESLLKRDLGVKDMSTLLPGHGGFMDRLDSIVLAAPTAYALLVVLAPLAS